MSASGSLLLDSAATGPDFYQESINAAGKGEQQEDGADREAMTFAAE